MSADHAARGLQVNALWTESGVRLTHTRRGS
jgi:hypothetical protein